ncbi:hypothetical protein BGW80DRAFT_1367305 [Lactifluus volemus]|nr:hypothetical protein BGW80DRAFT_1367305 [Lactifluus volemus]
MFLSRGTVSQFYSRTSFSYYNPSFLIYIALSFCAFSVCNSAYVDFLLNQFPRACAEY